MKITFLKDGPILFGNDVEIVHNGKVVKGAICRCGQTNNSPFCDGSHLGCGFKRRATELIIEFPDVSEDS